MAARVVSRTVPITQEAMSATAPQDTGSTRMAVAVMVCVALKSECAPDPDRTEHCVHFLFCPIAYCFNLPAFFSLTIPFRERTKSGSLVLSLKITRRC